MKCEKCEHEIEEGVIHVEQYLDGGCLISPYVEKVVFLDIDGVLNSRKWFEKNKTRDINPYREMDPKLVKIFNRIIEETGAKIVLSSAWRTNPKWHENMIANGITDNFIDRTGNGEGGVRGMQIRRWLIPHKEILRYAIIDDDSDMLWGQPLFKTDWEIGLTDDIADQVIEYLNGNKKYVLTEREYELL